MEEAQEGPAGGGCQHSRGDDYIGDGPPRVGLAESNRTPKGGRHQDHGAQTSPDGGQKAGAEARLGDGGKDVGWDAAFGQGASEGVTLTRVVAIAEKPNNPTTMMCPTRRLTDRNTDPNASKGMLRTPPNRKKTR